VDARRVDSSATLGFGDGVLRDTSLLRKLLDSVVAAASLEYTPRHFGAGNTDLQFT